MKLTIHIRREPDSYDILIGEELLDTIVSDLSRGVGRYVIITDTNVKKLYGKELFRKLSRAGAKASIISIKPGETSKSLEAYAGIVKRLFALGITRDSEIIALGGGVVGDLAGFVASTYMRGVSFIQIPTTLLAMVDSSVGGKTGVNLPQGKNILGTFHQPRKVFIDLNTLDTLPEEEFANGMVELMKHAIIRNKALFEMLERKTPSANNKAFLAKIISESLKVKAEIVQLDEKEQGLRMLLNYGHTFGHALEALSSYKLKHGTAVGIGMMLAARLSHSLRSLNEQELRRHNAAISRYVSKMPEYEPSKVIEKMLSDKKVRNQKLSLVLLKSIGEAYIENAVPLEAVKEVLACQS